VFESNFTTGKKKYQPRGTSMKKLLIAAAAVACFSAAPASAQAPMFDWSTFYVGGNAGAMWNDDIGGGFTIPAAPGNSFIANGQTVGIAGIHGGLQRQWGNWILGAEGGFSATFSGFGSSNGLGNAPPIGCNAAVVFACEGRINNIFQVGPRLGWGQNQWMVYGTGGWANARIETRARTLLTGSIISSVTTTNNGWFAGGGFEWAIAPRATFGIEYMHYDFSGETARDGGNSRNVSTSADVVRARLTLLFVPPFK